MLRKIHTTNFFTDCTNKVKYSRPVLPPAQVYYFNYQAFDYDYVIILQKMAMAYKLDRID
jgi:hypothetical protein